MSLGPAMEEAFKAVFVIGIIIGLALAGLGWLLFWLVRHLNWSWI
jgi:hypothetical protein